MAGDFAVSCEPTAAVVSKAQVPIHTNFSCRVVASDVSCRGKGGAGAD